MEGQSPDIIVNLELGDIIKILAPNNNTLNNVIFIIDYIDNTEINLINTDSRQAISLSLNELGNLRDESIVGLELLNRSDKMGYAQQNNLLPNTWIDLYFKTDVPLIITGKIINLEEDMIEILVYSNNKIIYIDFAYKGLPKNLNINRIVIRNTPIDAKNIDTEDTSLLKQTESDANIEEDDDANIEEDDDANIEEDIIIDDDTISTTQLTSVLIDADQIVFGPDLGEITQIVQVADHEQRHSINVQTNDLLDELLSNIPYNKRTPYVLNNIHLMIDRFKQLRKQFSNLDQYGNVEIPIKKGIDHKPLVDSLYNLNQKLYWVLPVVTNKKKLYDNELDNIDNAIDYDPLTLAQTRIEESDIIKQYETNDIPENSNNYQFILSEINTFQTPFIPPINPDNNIIYKETNTDMLAIVDNLGEQYSSVSKDQLIKQKRFLLENYILGISGLKQSGGIDHKKIIPYERKLLTSSDTMYIKSFITLQEPILRFSYVNLPGTTILDRSHLSSQFLNYWQVLRNTTNINTKLIDNLKIPLEYKSDTYLSNITEYILDDELLDIDDNSQDEIYKMYLENIIPNTRTVFNLVKKYITGKLSLVKILNYLEPFMIYNEDITYKQYEGITRYLFDKILEYKSNYIKRGREFSKLRQMHNAPITIPNLITEILSNDNLTLYQLPTSNITNSETLCKLTLIDNMNLLITNITKNNFEKSLMVTQAVSNKLESGEDDTDEWSVKSNTTSSNNQCSTYIIAKQYDSLDELTSDNNSGIFFDKKYDNTNYDIINKYSSERNIMDDEPFQRFLIERIIETTGMNIHNAKIEAESIITKNRRVINGNYAVLINTIKSSTDSSIKSSTDSSIKSSTDSSTDSSIKSSTDSSTDSSIKSSTDSSTDSSIKPEYQYYIRENNMWVLDNTVDSSIFIQKSDIFCNLNKDCYASELTNCQTFSDITTQLKERSLDEIIKEFDDIYNLSTQQLTTLIDYQLTYSQQNISKLIELNTTHKYLDNNKQYQLGLTKEENDILSSPYNKLRDLILGQTNLIKRQTDIHRFCNKFTRIAIEDNNETPHWLYCIKTSVKLLPTFIFDLVECFINGGNYILKLNELCAKIGTLSDDGEAWVDKHSGYTIKNVDLDYEEGYDDSGFKIDSREILKPDLGNAIIGEESIKYLDKQSEMIANVVTSISGFMGINLNSQIEFIIKSVNETIEKTGLDRDKYIAKTKHLLNQEGAKIQSYDEVYNTMLLLLILIYIHITIQTSIPAIKTRKTFPGCVKSFDGYPLNGIEDMTGLIYIACIANKIKNNSVKLWSSIKQMNERKLVKKMKTLIDKYVLNNPIILKKINDKLQYIEITPPDQIPEEHNILLWTNFLPPLQQISINNLHNVSKNFKNSLIQDLKTGSTAQTVKILTLNSKIILYSLYFQQTVQDVLDTKSPILTNSIQEPFLENACCNDIEDDIINYNTFNYFNNEDKNIEISNKAVIYLSNILEDVIQHGKAPILYNIQNTNPIYPIINEKYSERTIYLTFIEYCKYNTNTSISEQLLSICGNKPENFNSLDSLDEKIKKLKQSDVIFDYNTFDKLLQVVNSNNIIKNTYKNNVVSNIQRLRDLLTSFSILETDSIPGIFKEYLTDLLDTFSIIKQDNSTIRNLKNYLNKTNSEMKSNILEFIKLNSTLKPTQFKKIELFINTLINMENIEDIGNMNDNLSKFLIRTKTHKLKKQNMDIKSNIASNISSNTSTSIDATYNRIVFLQNIIHNITEVLPNIVLNKVDYTDISIPRHWKLSNIHSADIVKIISNSYNSLINLYNNESISICLNKFKQLSVDFKLLSLNTPLFSQIHSPNKDEIIDSIFNAELVLPLFEYYVLSLLSKLISIKDNKSTKSSIAYSNFEKAPTFEEDELEYRENPEDIAIEQADKNSLDKQIAKILIVFINISITYKQTINYTPESIKEKILRSKEREKDKITNYLKNLPDDEREIENMFKNNKLEKWSKGLQKGLTQYVRGTYDEERLEIEQQSIMDLKMNQNHDITDRNREIYQLDIDEIQQEDNRIETEEFNMSNMADDDDFGDLDTDLTYD